MSTLLINELIERGRITPFAGNTFNVVMFGRDEPTRDEAMEFEKVHLRCSRVQIGSPSLRFTNRHPLSRQQLIEGVEFVDTVSITWLEDQWMNVWNYHRAWFTYFYDRERDQFRSGLYGKKRIAEIYIQEIRDESSTNVPNTREGEAGTVQHFLALEGLMPTSLPDLSLGWGNDSSQSTEVEMTYRIDTLRYQMQDPRSLSTEESWRLRSRIGGTSPHREAGVEI